MGVGENIGINVGENVGSRGRIITPAGNETIGTLINANFNDGTLGALAGGPDGFSDPFLSVYSNEESYDGGQSAKMTIQSGSEGWGEWGGIFNFPTFPVRGEELWARVRMFWPVGWIIGGKTFRIHIATSSGGNIGYLDIYNTDTYWRVQNEVQDYAENIPYDVAGLKGTWMTLEHYVFIHETTPVHKVWINGEKIYHNTTAKTCDGIGDRSDLSIIHSIINTPFFPVTQSDYLDDVVMTASTPNQTDASGDPFIGI